MQPSTSSVDKDAPKLRLGHYSSADGLFGIVLDRTVSPPRAKIDGRTTVMELAVRRDGQDRAYLLSSTGELSLLVDDRGGVSRLDANKVVRLRRDGDAAALPEPAAPAPAETLLRDAESKSKQSCEGASIRYELEGKPTSARGLDHTVQRSLRVLAAVCRDAPGKEAVKKKLQRVRIGQSTGTKVSFTNGTLSIAGALDGEGMGPWMDEIQPELEKKL